jgi:hypothetical protein
MVTFLDHNHFWKCNPLLSHGHAALLAQVEESSAGQMNQAREPPEVAGSSPVSLAIAFGKQL